jgi:HAE1 family hydrophobic/amphiphilic exporter-1
VLGSSTTTVEFELHSDMQKATDDVRTAVERARVELPTGIDPPLVQRLDIDSAPILTYAVSAPGMGDTELSRFIDKVVTRALQAQAGVAQVRRIGGAEREINVVLDAQRMAALGVTAPQVNDALAAFNSDDPGGRADVGDVEQTIRVVGSAMTIDRLRALSIPVQGRYVRLSDIAEIGARHAMPATSAWKIAQSMRSSSFRPIIPASPSPSWCPPLIPRAAAFPPRSMC